MARSLADLRQYLAGEWLFDNDFKDTSGNGNHGTPTDIEWASTNRGLKPRFNGSSSYIDCGNDNSLDITGNQLTIHIIARMNNHVGALLSKDNGSANTQYTVICANNKVEFRISADSNAVVRTTDEIIAGKIYHFTAVYNGATIAIYNEGVLVSVPVNVTGDISSIIENLKIGARASTSYYLDTTVAGSYIYSTALTPTEILALYNATSGEYGVRVAEFSHQHDPAAVIPITADTVLQIGGKLAGDAVDTISDRALSNDATIHGAMPADGFFAGGRRFDGVDDYLDCGNDSSLNITDEITYVCILRYPSNGSRGLIRKGNQYAMRISSDRAWWWGGSGVNAITAITDTSDNKTHVFIGASSEITGMQNVFVDGVVEKEITDTGGLQSSANAVYVGIALDATSEPFDGILYVSMVINGTLSLPEKVTFFNTLAVLPFWSLRFTDYPNNPVSYTTRFPHSSSVISSGSFMIDDDLLQCVSTGSMAYSASNEFDSQEYLTIDKGLPTEFSGTGTATSGTISVGVTQGSNKISISMNTSDVISSIDVQFRAEV